MANTRYIVIRPDGSCGDLAGELLQRLAAIDAKLAALQQQERQNMTTTTDYINQLKAKLDAQSAAIAKESDLDDSIIALLNANAANLADLKQRVLDSTVDPTAAKAISDLFDANAAALQANNDKLAAAVTANTPSA